MKKLVLFGSGTVAEKNLVHNPSFIVDNNMDLHGTRFHGLPVKPPSILEKRNQEYQIIICTTSIDAVVPQLEAYGYEWDRDFSIADQLLDRVAIDRLERLHTSFLISSGLPSHVNDSSGGGLYSVTENSDGLRIKKLFSGNVHGLIRYENNYLFNAQGDGIYCLENINRDPIKMFSVPNGFRPHGMCVYGDKFLMVSSYTDSVLIVDKTGKIEEKIELSSKKSTYGSAQHHCNDICVVGDYAYVSMFSVTGNWKRGVFDGGIVEIDLNTGEKVLVTNNLTMPHNITYYNGEMRVLNSFKGEILLNNFEQFGSLPGFVRGLDEDDSYIYVGESKNRNFSRLNTSRSPVSIDTRITIIDKKFKCSKSIQLPRSISEIHSVICIA